jgi:hypothetical protein
MYVPSISYQWYVELNKASKIVKVFKLNDIPYCYNDISETESTASSVISEANANKAITPDIILKGSSYLILELAHPLLFDIEVTNPRLLPQD